MAYKLIGGIIAAEHTKGRRAAEIQVYSGAPHAFTVFGSDRYQKQADEQSWDAFTDFLATNLPE